MWPLSPLFCQFPIRQSWSRTSVLNRSLTLQLTRPNTLPVIRKCLSWLLDNDGMVPWQLNLRSNVKCLHTIPNPNSYVRLCSVGNLQLPSNLKQPGNIDLHSEFTGFSTQTFYQTIPPYVAAGLSELEFGLAALLVVAVVAAAMLFRFVRGTTGGSSVAKAELPSGTVRYCQHCGAENRRTDKFCDKCGAKLG